MTYAALSPKAQAVLAELEALQRAPRSGDDEGYNQIVGVSDESDIVSSGPGSLLTPEGRGRSRTPGVRR